MLGCPVGSSFADDVVPGDVAQRSGDLDCAGQGQKVGCTGEDGAVALDAEHDLVALGDPERVARRCLACQASVRTWHRDFASPKGKEQVRTRL